MTPLWLALLAEDPGDAQVTPAHDVDGRQAGLLCTWRQKDRPHDQALQADPRVHDSGGSACVVSWALAPAHARPIADDPAIVQARRAVLRDGRPCAVTLLTEDPVFIAGALSIARADNPAQVAALADDPFSRLWKARLLSVGAGVLGRLVRPTGPSLERYGGRPWPWDLF